MCKFKSASYRQGMVVSAGSNDNRADKNRSVSEARTIGKAIVKNGENYVKTIRGKLHACLGVAMVRPSKIDKNDTVRSRFDPGLILDFQSLTVETNLGMISMRTCLTVCSNGFKSKIWTRLALQPHTILGNESELSPDELAKFYQLADSIAESVNDATRTLYEKDFSAVVEKNIKLSSDGKIHVFAVDCDGSGIGSSIYEFYSKLSWTEAHIAKVTETELADALRKVTNASAKNSISQALQNRTQETGSFTLNTTAHFFPYMSTKGTPSIFVSHTLDDEAFLIGLVDAENCTFDDTQETGIASQKTTAEIASLLGQQF